MEGNGDQRKRRMSKRRAPSIAAPKPKGMLHWIARKFNFYRVLSCYYIVSAIIAAVVISYIDDLRYMDGLFLAVSAITSTGLSTVSMAELSRGSFATLAVLILGGSALVVPLGAILYRRMKYVLYRELQGLEVHAISLLDCCACLNLTPPSTTIPNLHNFSPTFPIIIFFI